MKLFCAGEQIFCEFFALIGAEYAVCGDEAEVIETVLARGIKDELVILSESLCSSTSHEMKHLLNDPKRCIITLPVSSAEQHVQRLQKSVTGYPQ